MSSPISLYLVKDLEYNSGWTYDSFTPHPVITIKGDDLKVDKSQTGYINPADLKAVHDLVHKLKFARGAIISFSGSGNRRGYGNSVLNVDGLHSFYNHVLPNSFIRIDGKINASCGSSAIWNGTVNIRVSCKDNAGHQIAYLSSEHGLQSLGMAQTHQEIQLGSELNPYRSTQIQMKLTLSVLLEWEQQLIASVKLSGDSIVRKMYANESTKDYTIVSSNGVKVKCHGFILAAHSPVLDRMINPSSEMKEAKSKTIELKDMTEDGIKRLLQYLYGLELSTKECNCKLVVELLQAAHKYELTHLEKSLAEILLQRDESWYNPDSILELYFFVKLLEHFGALRDYLLQIMTRMSKELRKCKEIKTLTRDDMADLLWELFDVLKNEGANAAIKNPNVAAPKAVYEYPPRFYFP